jgi:TatA/E family protein of Tat protein translocase
LSWKGEVVFGISGTELLIVAVFAFVIFGPDKIPEIARTVSKAINMFKRTQEDMERLIKAEMSGIDPEKVAGSMLGLNDDAPAEKDAKKPSRASSLYGIVDDEEEDEE